MPNTNPIVLLDTPLKAQAKRIAGGDDAAYQDCLQEGRSIVCKMFPRHVGTGLLTWLMLYACSARGAAREEAKAAALWNGPEMDRAVFDSEGNEVEFGEDLVVPVVDVLPSRIDMLPSGTEIWNSPDSIMVFVEGRWFTVPEGNKKYYFTAPDTGDIEHPSPVYIMSDAAIEAAKKKWNRDDFFAVDREDDDDLELEADGRDRYPKSTEPFEDNEFFDMAEIVPGRYLGAKNFRRGFRLLGTYRTTDGNTFNNWGARKSVLVYDQSDDGDPVKDDGSMTDEQAAKKYGWPDSTFLDSELDALSETIPTDRAMEDLWDKFHKEIEPDGTYGVEYIYTVIRSLTQGFGWEESVGLGKAAFHAGVAAKAAALHTTKPQLKEAPKVASKEVPVTGRKLSDVIERLAASGTVPSLSSAAKAQREQAFRQAKIVQTVPYDKYLIVKAEVKSSRNGPIPYQVIVALDHKGHVFKGLCSCPAGSNEHPVGCYHEEAVSQLISRMAASGSKF